MAPGIVKHPISTGPVTVSDGRVLTEADIERMAVEAETMDIDIERLLERQRSSVVTELDNSGRRHFHGDGNRGSIRSVRGREPL